MFFLLKNRSALVVWIPDGPISFSLIVFSTAAPSYALSGTALDQYGRIVSPDSFMIETAGCRQRIGRVDVENYQRPQYFELVNLDGFGVQGNLYSDDSGNRTAAIQNLSQIVGNPGYDYGHYVTPRCVNDRYEQNQYESRSMCR